MTRGIADTLDEARLRTLLAELARDAMAFRFEVAPNPAVGAAVIAGDEVLGRGFHRVWGEAHAEIAAIDAAIQSGAPTTRFEALVVTLEPCSSHGKTPPCVERILQSGIRCVVVGALDPDPRHRGRGSSSARGGRRGRAARGRIGAAQGRAALLELDRQRARAPSAAVDDREVGADAFGSMTPPPALAADAGSPVPKRSRKCRSCAAASTRSSPASAPCWRTIRASPCGRRAICRSRRCASCSTATCARRRTRRS
jgi:pyrimidine deaminase RibD-like protein